MKASWDDLRFALSVAKTGSLARAARELGVDHTTVGRRIAALERSLGASLFLRTAAGHVLTEEGEELLPSLRAVEEAIASLDRANGAREDCLRGTVRVTCGEAVAVRLVGPQLGLLQERHPELDVELVPTPRTLDLGRREADVALRFFRSTDAQLVVRKAAEARYSLYASKDYLRRAGRPRRTGDTLDLSGHRVVGDERRTPAWPETLWFELHAQGVRHVLRTDSSLTKLSATKAGLGIGFLPCFLGGDEPGLVRLATPGEPVEPLWLTVHKDMQRVPRVRAIVDWLARVLKDARPLLTGAS